MQALRNSIYLIVAVGSIALAACQPYDRFSDSPGVDIGAIAALSSLRVDSGAASSESPEGSQPQAPQ